MSFVEAPVPGEHLTDQGVVVCRTGYTGERGYELIASNEVAVALWDALMAAGEELGMLPCGLGARDTLRTEMGYPLHGQDISLTTSPPTRPASAGRSAGRSRRSGVATSCSRRRRTGPTRILRGLVSTGRAIPRPGMRVSLTPDVLLGEVTSGTFSPTLKQGDRPGAALHGGQPRGRGRRRRTRPPRDLPAHHAAVRRALGPRGAMNLPEQPPTFRPPEPGRAALVVAAGGRLRCGGDRARPSYAGRRFASQADAESWVGETWSDLAELGVAAVTLIEHDRVVYGPMSLSA